MSIPAIPRRPRPSLLDAAHADSPSLWRLAQDEASVATLYRLLGEFCHAFRNRLHSLQLCLYLTSPEGSEGDTATGTANAGRGRDQAYRALLGVVERVQEVCRPVGHDPTALPFALVLQDRLASWRRSYSPGVDRIQVRPAEPPEVEVRDAMRLAHALDGLVAWRLAASARKARPTLAWRVANDRLHLEWSEDCGPSAAGGVPCRGALPLAVLARLVAANGGTIDVCEAPTFRVALSWPALPDVSGAASPVPGGVSGAAVLLSPRVGVGRP
jgi:hypothetical protein